MELCSSQVFAYVKVISSAKSRIRACFEKRTNSFLFLWWHLIGTARCPLLIFGKKNLRNPAPHPILIRQNFRKMGLHLVVYKPRNTTFTHPSKGKPLIMRIRKILINPHPLNLPASEVIIRC